MRGMKMSNDATFAVPLRPTSPALAALTALSRGARNAWWGIDTRHHPLRLLLPARNRMNRAMAMNRVPPATKKAGVKVDLKERQKALHATKWRRRKRRPRKSDEEDEEREGEFKEFE
jgi:hypothetical protein